MAGVGGVRAPSLSEVQAWDVTHLEIAVRDWTTTAQHWESSFTAIHRSSASPGGTVWEGAAAEAAQERAFADLVKILGLADVLHESAAIARRGAETLYSTKRSVLDAVEEASAAGYTVGEDLSVTPPRGGVVAQAQAQVYVTQIHQRAVQLAAHDYEIAAKITTTIAPLNQVSFVDAPSPAPQPPTKNGHIQAVDHTWAQNPPPAPGVTDGTSGDDIRRVLDKLPVGNQPFIREVRSAEDLQSLWNWAKQHGVEIPNGYGDVTKGVRYQLPDGTTIGQRWVAASNGKPALDITMPNQGGYTKVHINPRGGVPDLPRPATPRPVGPAAAGEPTVTPQPSGRPPIETGPRTRTAPGAVEGGGGLPGPLFSGLPPNSPATGPHPIHIPHTLDHKWPLLGEIPQEFEGPEE